MSDSIIARPDNIQQRIHYIRGVQVMLDKDLAELYDVKPIRLREQLKRNSNRFPNDFMVQLNDEEVNLMVSQNAIPSRQVLGGFMPYVFTEQGVAALSSVLTSERAVEVSILIMRAFIAMRRFLISNAQVFQRLDALELKQNQTEYKIEKVLNALEEKSTIPKQGIFFDGQVFDAWKFASDLIRSASSSLILIDNYIDDTVLQLFAKRKREVTVTLLTKAISAQLKTDVEKFNSQYEPVLVKEFADSHDRFLIIDDKDIYYIGASLKDLGKMWFAFSKIEMGAVQMLNKVKLL
jgi:hypothetical protein